MKSAGFHMKSAEFHEIQRISKDQLPGMVTPMFHLVDHPDGYLVQFHS